MDAALRFVLCRRFSTLLLRSMILASYLGTHLVIALPVPSVNLQFCCICFSILVSFPTSPYRSKVKYGIILLQLMVHSAELNLLLFYDFL